MSEGLHASDQFWGNEGGAELLLGPGAEPASVRLRVSTPDGTQVITLAGYRVRRLAARLLEMAKWEAEQ